MELIAKLSDTALFLREVFSQPRQVGAIMPSSRNLAAAMARWLPEDPEAYVLELGPGTGAVTEALLNQGLAENRLIAIEKSPKLAEHLRRRFPRSLFITGDALHLDRLLARQARRAMPVAAVVSSLPLLNFDPRTAQRLVNKIQSILTPTGRLVQYSYHLGNKRSKSLAAFKQKASDIVWLNLPPARVTVYEMLGLARAARKDRGQRLRPEEREAALVGAA
ncbi:MAG: methyltransferase domain-containing protein [Verrucomicrobia bacterium]|nr:methyltransferase domain-containing protein [Verrucomicrobiota bacterium]